MAQLQKVMKEAVDEALGFGHGIEQQSLEVIRRRVEPMWRALHKIQEGRVDRRSFRYVVQRYFMQRLHLSIVGLEANLAADTESEAALLTSYAPNYVRKVLEGDSSRNGFAMEDAVAMIAALVRLIEHTGTDMLENVYNTLGMDMKMDASREQMFKVMDSYILRWMMSGDMEGVAMIEANETFRAMAFDDWDEISGFAHAQVNHFEYARQHSKELSSVSAWNALRPHFSFADAQAMVGSMAISFGDFWETECADVKSELMKLDYNKNGRVKLSDFHGTATGGEWRFSESKEYLRQMGALDETSTWRGPSVIVTNYLQAPSNCIITTEHYRVCCANECDEYLKELEESIGGAVATPEEILSIIERIRTGFDDEEPKLTYSLKSQLKQIAQTHAGKVPIHGRLFSQWMHYVFPLECAFPHKSGTTSTLTPSDFGDGYMVSNEELAAHTLQSTSQTNDTALLAAETEDEWKSKWSHEEELLTDLSSPSWQADFSTSVLGLMVVASVGMLLVKSGLVSTRATKDVLPTSVGGLKSHYV